MFLNCIIRGGRLHELSSVALTARNCPAERDEGLNEGDVIGRTPEQVYDTEDCPS